MENVRYYIGLLCLFLNVIACNSKNFQYSIVSNIYEEFVHSNIEAKNIVDYLPTNYVKDGTIDYTDYIQKAINENSNVSFPNFPLLVNEKGIKLKSNSSIFFDINSALILMPTTKDTYSVLQIYDIKNVNIYNPTLIGDRKNHEGNKGEWGMGIRIQDSENINIYNVNIKDMWGDGIYITSYTNVKSNNITIKNGLIDNVRRNGISIISGKNITIDSVQISNTNGTPPASGIDVEPNKSTDIIQNLKLMNILTVNNERDGIILDFTNLVNNENKNEVTVIVKNHRDKGSRYGFRFAAFRKSNKNEESLKGNITVENAEWNDTKMKIPFRIGEQSEQYPEVVLKDIKTNMMNKKMFDREVQNIIKSKRQFKFN